MIGQIHTNQRLFNQLVKTDPIILDEWAITVRRRIYALARSAQPASPYLDPPDIQDRWDKGRFWVAYYGEISRRTGRVKRRAPGHSVKYSSSKSAVLNIFGIAPNPGRIRGAHAPDRQYKAHSPYTAFFGGKFHRMHQSQVTTEDIGIGVKQPYYLGTPMDADDYFAVDGAIYGRSEIFGSFFGLRVWAEDSYADWLVKSRGDEIEKIIYESLQDVMDKYYMTDI